MARVVPEQMVDHEWSRACADRLCDRAPLYVKRLRRLNEWPRYFF